MVSVAQVLGWGHHRGNEAERMPSRSAWERLGWPQREEKLDPIPKGTQVAARVSPRIGGLQLRPNLPFESFFSEHRCPLLLTSSFTS